MILMENMTIVYQRELAPEIFELVLSGDMVADMEVGQFLHLKVPDGSMLLRRPISISQIDKEKGYCHLVYRIEGAGTRLLSGLEAGEQIDCMGPQGNGFETAELMAGQKALIIGGGIGVPPLVALAKELQQKGLEVVSVIGFATKAAVILEEELAACGQVYVTTDDGSYGIKGNVSVVLNDLAFEPDAVYACGAAGMLAYVDTAFAQHPRAYISMESRMACGMGACYACVVPDKTTDGKTSLRVCQEGPVFETGRVILK